MLIKLNNRNIIKISGNDRFEFLQGLITNDINKLKTQESLYAAMLSPQGKFLFDMIIINYQDFFYLDVWNQTKNDLIKRLNMYKLKAEIELDDLSEELNIYCHNKYDKEYFCIKDPRDNKLGYRIITEEFFNESDSFTTYEKLRIKNKIPDGGIDIIPNKSFILDHNFDTINGVDFNKGCYVGQELVARMHSKKGNFRKKLEIIESANLPNYLEPVFDEKGDFIGEMRSKVNLGSKEIGLAFLKSAAEI